MRLGRHRKSSKKIITLLPFYIFILVICILFKYSLNTEYSINNISEEKNTIETSLSAEPFQETVILNDVEVENLIHNYIVENNLNEDNFAFFYYNFDTKKEYFYNEYVYFTAASTVKLPVAMLYYDKINSGNISGSDTLLYESNCYEAGNGTTNYYYSAGDYIPISFLLEQSIVNSDNTAVNILMNNIGTSVECRKQINKYTNETVPENFYNSNLTYAKYSFDILNYLYSNIENYEELIKNLKISSNGEYLKKYVSNYDIAHKYGSYNGYVHDYGIVFGKNTYLIGIFTKNVPDAAELIANISLDILNYTLD